MTSNDRPPRARRPSRLGPVRIGLVIALALSALGATEPRDDRYLAGYAAAVVERDLGLRLVSVEVQDGVARVVVEALNGQPPEWVAAAVVQIEGIERAEVSVGTSDDAPAAVAVREPSEDEEGLGIELLPRIELFDPLIADPRWPHIGVAYRRYFDSEVNNVGVVDFGETIPLLGGPVGDGRWEFGVLGGVFSIFDLFDLSADSSDLLNTDFWGGISFSGRWDWLSGQIRVYHQSSHLGDEFILNNYPVERVNVSYEAADLLLSADVRSWLRLYVGGGGIFHDTTNLDPGLFQAGFQLQSPDAYLGDYLRPIAGFDYQTAQELDWHENISIVAGFQIESPLLSPVRVQILGEFFTGNSPDGQFYVKRIKYAGVGAHIHF